MSDELNIRQQILAQIAQACVEHGLRDFIISPGSRSAPLTATVAQHPDLRCRVVIDERAAAYVALGLAQQSRAPVGLICTSGTAALNFAPAVTEAFYQQIPLVVFTADRPPEWIDQQDNQAIHQRALYAPHCRGYFELPVEYAHADAQWYALRQISEAFQQALGPVRGPVQINAPLREPLYGAAPVAQPIPPPKIIRTASATPQLATDQWRHLQRDWQAAGRKLVLVGTHALSSRLQRSLRHLDRDPHVAIIGDVTGNIFPDGTRLSHADAILGSRNAQTLDVLAPDLLVTLGGPVVSKYLKNFLRRRPPAAHWHLHPGGLAADTFQTLTHVLPVAPAPFLDQLAWAAGENLPSAPGTEMGYKAEWLQREAAARQHLQPFFEQAPFGEFQAVYRILQALPQNGRLQVGNSMVIRYVNFIGRLPGHHFSCGPVSVSANRGASGIDGAVSTAVGAALATTEMTTLLVGDLGFFYDRNALWHAHVPRNLRIVILNNHGGGIFDLIDGPNQLDPELRKTYFLTPQPLTAQRTAADHGCDYWHCKTGDELALAFKEFFRPRARAGILEIETDMQVNGAVFQAFKQLVATSW
ncbi:MAG: 2-succinyl-5-enolpyruvyl-6-hydroxy-3-cyclohexene-1-carboxylic-acid synthase [Caldilineaceae bacterium]|nr:2-succinyl-5-enolpyruvyl-6-hydroxy-3-cyclohexene-1-carboxylic-acid synthase [Caldilineaceae bacterium]